MGQNRKQPHGKRVLAKDAMKRLMGGLTNNENLKPTDSVPDTLRGTPLPTKRTGVLWDGN